MKQSTHHLLVLYTLMAATIGYMLFKSPAAPKSAYVNSINIYNDFKLKKELEKKLLATEQARKNILDSLMLELKLMNGQLQSSPGNQGLLVRFEQKKQSYLEQEQVLKSDTERQKEEYTQQIWKHLNQYIEEYGKENGYAYIYGADGSGSLMYASDAMDITKDVLLYAEEKYQGK